MAMSPVITTMKRASGSVRQSEKRDVLQERTPPCDEQVPEPTEPLTHPSRQIAPILGPHSVLRRTT